MQKKNTQIYRDDIALFCYPEQYRLGIYKMEQGDIVEIDNLEELATPLMVGIINELFHVDLSRRAIELYGIK